MIYSKIPLAQTVVLLCKLKGIKHIIISPGSRNAPLIIGFTNDTFFKCYSIVDERCAAFFALGIAQQLKEPTAVVCTSGSALLNYYPAISEAFYSDIPLVVLSADRPKYLVGIGDGQTLNQKDVFKNHILFSANLKLDLKDEKDVVLKDQQLKIKKLKHKFADSLSWQKSIQTRNENKINKAINHSIISCGPVHINIPLDEPLYETVNTLNVTPEADEIKFKHKSIADYTIKECLESWNSSKRKLILVGVNSPNTIEKEWLDHLAQDTTVIMFTETTSNLHHNAIFSHIDQIVAPLNTEQEKELHPDILITFGGLIVSKKMKAILRRNKPKEHWHIDIKKANDTFFSLTKHIETTPNIFFETLLPKIRNHVEGNYKFFWNTIKQKRLKKHKAYVNTVPFSDFKCFSLILKSIPNNTILQVGNSSAIRYTQLFNLNKTVEVFCNRGTSGIDGSTSTAIGSAVAHSKQNVFITGDLSFLYDSNALWNNYIPNNFRIIVVNNQGGGIFRILPGHKNTENFDTFFETKHHLTAEHLCKMYNFKYEVATNTKSLELCLKSFYQENERPKLLEVFTPKGVNDEVLLNYFEYMK